MLPQLWFWSFLKDVQQKVRNLLHSNLFLSKAQVREAFLHNSVVFEIVFTYIQAQSGTPGQTESLYNVRFLVLLPVRTSMLFWDRYSYSAHIVTGDESFDFVFTALFLRKGAGVNTWKFWHVKYKTYKMSVKIWLVRNASDGIKMQMRSYAKVRSTDFI